MDIRMLPPVDDGKMVQNAYLTLANRQKRRQSFTRYILIYGALCLLFIGFGCFYSIYLRDTGAAMPELTELNINALPIRQSLKLFFILCVPLIVVFCTGFTPLCMAFSGFCPAFCGAVYGAYAFAEAYGLVQSQDMTKVAESAAFLLCGVIYCLCVTVFSAVASAYRASFASVDRKQEAESYFLYFAYTAAVVFALCALRLTVLYIKSIFII